MNATTRHLLRAIGAVGLILSATACGSSTPAASPTTLSKTGLQGVLQSPPTRKPEFTLTDTSGMPYDFGAETRGKLTFLYFGYTNCPDICQIRMQQMAAVEARPGVPKADVVFVTVDPARDTTSVLKKWLDHFDSSFVGLTGTPQQVEAAEEASGVPPATEQPGAKIGQYFMSHPADMQAFAPDGRGYTTYPFGTTIDEFVHDMDILVKRTP